MPDGAGAKSPSRADAALGPLRWVVLGLAGVAGLSFLAMMGITCADIVARRFGGSVSGAVDLVELCGAVGIACALPYTTAVKGHIAVEFFFHKLNRAGRVGVDAVLRTVSIAAFSVLAWRCVEKGVDLQRSGDATMTLRVPIFWVWHAMAFCLALMVLVILTNLLRPGRELIKP